MKILYVSQQFSPVIGGLEKVFQVYYEYFKKRYETRVITTNLYFNKPSKELLQIKDGIVRLPVIPRKVTRFEKLFYWHVFRRFYGPTLNFDFSFPKRLMIDIARTDFDILHASSLDTLTTYWAQKISKKLKKPFILTPALHEKKERPNLKYRLLYLGQPDFKIRIIKNADLILPFTKTEKEKIIKYGARPENLKIIPPGINPSDYPKNDLTNLKNKINYSQKDKIILFIARRNKHKGLQILIDSLKLCPKETKLIIVGPERDPVFYPNNLKNRIFDLGIASEKEKREALELCHIFCLPSIKESFGLVYLEAWMYEKPVIACNIPTSREIIDSGKDGFLVNQDSKDIARKINFLLKNPILSNKMGRAGKRKTLVKYTWDKIMPQIEEIYKIIYKTYDKKRKRKIS